MLKIWFSNQLIRNKIIVIYIPLIIISMFVVGYFSNIIYNGEIVRKTIKNVFDNSTLIVTRIDSMLTNTVSCATMITINLNEIIHESDSSSENTVDELVLANRIKNVLNNALMIFPDVESAAFISINRKIYTTDGRLEHGLDRALESELIKSLDMTGGTNRWFPMQRRDFLVADEESPVLTIAKEIINIKSGNKLGSLFLNVKEESISSIYNNLEPGKQSSYLITDEDGIIISSQDKEELMKPIGDASLKQWILMEDASVWNQRINGEETLVTKANFSRLGWKMVSRSLIKELTEDVRKVNLLFLAVSMVCLAFTVLGAGILSKVIANPLVKLTWSMNNIRDEYLDFHFNIESKDEVGVLASGFNKMVGRIRNLLIDIRHEQKKKREYELALIQAQIKPHFLYNTLDVIYTLADMGRLMELKKATKSLADFYRVALSKGREIITIGEEISITTNYLFIQRIRYSDVFDFEVAISDEIGHYSINKLTIQPLVENAIYHGLKMKGSPGKILIEGFKEDNDIVIRIVDDGVGISEEKLGELLNFKIDSGQKTSFGLSNVDERIKIYYGHDYGLGIHSTIGKGTEVTVRIPAREIGEKRDDKDNAC